MVHVELVYIASDKNTVYLTLDLADGATVADALNQSHIYSTHPETKELSVGIYAKLVTVTTVLKDGDRIELYRPLALDPKDKRRLKAKLKKSCK